jgi:hypothetical protein
MASTLEESTICISASDMFPFRFADRGRFVARVLGSGAVELGVGAFTPKAKQ